MSLKKWISIAAMIGLVMGAFPEAGYADEKQCVSMTINGDVVSLGEEMGNAYRDAENNLMIPLRAVNVCLGYDTEWQKDGTIHIKDEARAVDVTMKIGSNVGEYNGKQTEFAMPVVINKKQKRSYISVTDFNKLYAMANWNQDLDTVEIYPQQADSATYHVADGAIVKVENGQSVKLVMPSDPDANLDGLANQTVTVTKKIIQDKTYLMVKSNEAVNNLSPLFCVEGNQAAFLGIVNGSSSYVIDGTTLYHTEGTDAGSFTAEINPRILLMTDLTGNAPLQEIELDFDINQCILQMKGRQLMAVTPNGQCQTVDPGALK